VSGNGHDRVGKLVTSSEKCCSNNSIVCCCWFVWFLRGTYSISAKAKRMRRNAMWRKVAMLNNNGLAISIPVI